MISRICVGEKGEDSRERIYVKSWAGLCQKNKITGVRILNSYLLDSKLSKEKLERAALALTNPAIEEFFVNELPEVGTGYAIEIGFLPGVTDNVGHTARETISDFLHLSDKILPAVYTSRVFLISGALGKKDAAKIAASLYNPLIERAYVMKLAEGKNSLPLIAPKVELKKRPPVIKVPLNIPDKELALLGKEGIPEGRSRRGPLALDLQSMKAIQEYFQKLGRAPNDIELESLAQTWSEHCNHTIFADPIDDAPKGLYKTYIKEATNLIRKKKGKRDFCISVFSDNSGGIIFDDEYMITHKVETHNSPSALDPFGGAITGIVGVNRDALGFGLGAKPVANAFGFCFGEPDDARPIYRGKDKKTAMFPPRRIMEGVIRGINSGGNCSGIPTLSGFVRYDDRFKGKPLVFAGTVGLIPRKIRGKPSHEKSAKPGDYVVMLGGRVGADGIHGATFSSVAMDSSSPATAVQIGDPITQKKLSDAIVREARGAGLYSSITDNGAGGLSCSVAEMAKESGGARVDLEKVPLKYPNLEPWQIWISESQERMTLSVPKKNWKEFNALMRSRGVEATVIGVFTGSGRMAVRWKGKTIMDMPLEFLHNGLPKHRLEGSPHTYWHEEPALPKGTNRTKELEKLLANNNVAGFSFISDQYDYEVQGGSVLKPLSGPGRINTDAQVFSPVLNSKKGVVLSTGVYPSYSDISTYAMAAAAIDTAVRNAVAAGAPLSHLAILDNFCWCSSYDKVRLFELHEALKACYKYAVGYGTPFISGKDSMWNDFRGYDEEGKPIKISIPPTLLISAIGVAPDVSRTVSPEFKNAGDLIYILGETNDELGASEYAKMLAGKTGAIGNRVPKVNLARNLHTYRALESAMKDGLVASAISVSSGGLGAALAKAAIGGMLGAEISLKNLPGNASTVDAKLFSESQGRVVLSIAPKHERAFRKIIGKNPFAKLGRVIGGSKFEIRDKNQKVVGTNVGKLCSAYHSFSKKMR